MAAGFSREPLDGCAHGVQIAPIAFVGFGLEALEVDVCCVDEGHERVYDVRACATARDEHVGQVGLVCERAHVANVLPDDERLVVGVGDPHDAPVAPVCAAGGLDQLCGRDLLPGDVMLSRLRDLPVLTEGAAQVAAIKPSREQQLSRSPAGERLLLDGVERKRGDVAIACGHNAPAHVASSTAAPHATLGDAAGVRADVAGDGGRGSGCGGGCGRGGGGCGGGGRGGGRSGGPRRGRTGAHVWRTTSKRSSRQLSRARSMPPLRAAMSICSSTVSTPSRSGSKRPRLPSSVLTMTP